MRNLHIVMPMGGIGLRFKQAGIDTPKPLIDILGKPMFLKAVSSFSTLQCNKKYTFIIRFDQDEEYHLANEIKKYIPDAQFVILTENTRGAVDTCVKALPYIDDNDAIVILDCDLEFSSEDYFNNIQKDLNNNLNNLHGMVVSFKSTNPRYSYAQVDKDNFVIKTAEKIVISDNALAGSYYFSNKKVFEKAALQLIKDYECGICTAKEVYLSLLYNHIINNGEKIKLFTLDKYNSFGTPEELTIYLNKINHQVKGHSGCTVEQKTYKNKIIIEKSTYNKQYIKRLKKQEDKQNNFYNFIQKNIIKNIYTPKIIYDKYNNQFGCFAMQFIDGISFIDYFESNNYDKFEKFAVSILNFLDFEFSNCKNENISYKIFYKKFLSVQENILKNNNLNKDNIILELLDLYKKIFSKQKNYVIPIGECHGDLTLSNIMFKDNEYYLIDFLDSFINTPLMDIVKLRQDTKYNWSYLLINDQKNFDISKTLLFELDKKITDHYAKNNFFIDSYKLLQQMNFLRILQYANNDKIILFLKITLQNLLK